MKPDAVHNHSDFARHCRELWGDWDSGDAERVLEARRLLDLRKEDGRGAVTDVDARVLLEAHVRGALLDKFLASLQWKMGATLHIEIGGPKDKDTRLYLDYFGISTNDTKPLLVFEAKRSSVKLPVVRSLDVDLATGAADEIAKILADPSNGRGPWVDILAQLCGYWEFATQKETAHALKRVAISNGDWLVVFTDPKEAFGSVPAPDAKASNVVVFEDKDKIIARSDEVFRLLAYSQLTDDKEWLGLGSVKNFFSDGTVEHAMFGLTLDYTTGITPFGPNPHIDVTPVVYLFAKGGGWVAVRDAKHFDTMPSRPDIHASHLATIDDFARWLLAGVIDELGYEIPVVPIDHQGLLKSEHLDPVRRSREVTGERYELITGADTHFWTLPDEPGPCKFHSWAAATDQGVAHATPVGRSSAKPRCFFADKHPCHCAHQHRFNAKSQAPRVDGKTSFAFCKIWEFEQYLCCRTCAYRSLCFQNNGIKACEERAVVVT